jgi:hypothetical protein
MSDELGEVILQEEAVLEKFDGDGPRRVLRERIVLVNKEKVKHEFFDKKGNLINTVEGGN